VKFNTASQSEAGKALTYLLDLTQKKGVIEVKKVSPRRSNQQNKYLHVTFGIFGLETGYDLQEAKTIYKRQANPNIYTYKKNGQVFLRSSADLSTAEMSDSIEKWRKYAAEQGIDIPSPSDEQALLWWENQIETQGKWL
jgi:hypothetical protein